MESIITDFHVDLYALVAQLVNFSIVVAVLYFFAFKPIVKMMTERSDKIAQGLKDAENSRAQLDNTEIETQSLLKEARRQADLIIAEANNQAMENQSAILIKTKEQVQAVVNQEKENIENELAKTLLSLKRETAFLAVTMAEKILGEKMDAHMDEGFINKITQ